MMLQNRKIEKKSDQIPGLFKRETKYSVKRMSSSVPEKYRPKDRRSQQRRR